MFFHLCKVISSPDPTPPHLKTTVHLYSYFEENLVMKCLKKVTEYDIFQLNDHPHCSVKKRRNAKHWCIQQRIRVAGLTEMVGHLRAAPAGALRSSAELAVTGRSGADLRRDKLLAGMGPTFGYFVPRQIVGPGLARSWAAHMSHFLPRNTITWGPCGLPL